MLQNDVRLTSKITPTQHSAVLLHGISVLTVCMHDHCWLNLFAHWCIGVIKTYMLTYESAEVMNALFDRNSSFNRWSIRASFLKENLDYFSPKVEQLDIFHENNKMTFLSYQDKVVTAKNGRFAFYSTMSSFLTWCRDTQAAFENHRDSQCYRF